MFLETGDDIQKTNKRRLLVMKIKKFVSVMLVAVMITILFPQQ